MATTDTSLVSELLKALEAAREVIENSLGNINPERGYAEELEADLAKALNTVRTAITKVKG